MDIRIKLLPGYTCSVMCDVGVSLYATFMQSVMVHVHIVMLCVPVSELVSCTFSTIVIYNNIPF